MTPGFKSSPARLRVAHRKLQNDVRFRLDDTFLTILPAAFLTANEMLSLASLPNASFINWYRVYRILLFISVELFAVDEIRLPTLDQVSPSVEFVIGESFPSG